MYRVCLLLVELFIASSLGRAPLRLVLLFAPYPPFVAHGTSHRADYTLQHKERACIHNTGNRGRGWTYASDMVPSAPGIHRYAINSSVKKSVDLS